MLWFTDCMSSQSTAGQFQITVDTAAGHTICGIECFSLYKKLLTELGVNYSLKMRSPQGRKYLLADGLTQIAPLYTVIVPFLNTKYNIEVDIVHKGTFLVSLHDLIQMRSSLTLGENIVWESPFFKNPVHLQMQNGVLRWTASPENKSNLTSPESPQTPLNITEVKIDLTLSEASALYLLLGCPSKTKFINILKNMV